MQPNRVTPYEEGWLEFLLNKGLADQSGLDQAMSRVCRAAADRWLAEEEERKRQRKVKRKKKKDDT